MSYDILTTRLEEKVMAEIHETLKRLGVRKSYCGYEQIVKSLDVVGENEIRFTRITDVYEQVADETGCRCKNIERNIRTIIDHVWNDHADELIYLAGYRMNGKPTVTEFLEILHEEMKKKEQN